MGFLNSLFHKKEDNRSRLAKAVDIISSVPDAGDRYIRQFDESLKLPCSQALAVLSFSRLVSGSIEKMAQERMLKTPPTTWRFPHDRIFVELVAFHYSCLMAKHQHQKDDDSELEDNDGNLVKSYSDVVKDSLLFANEMIIDMADTKLAERFVARRAFTYLSIIEGEDKQVVQALIGNILKIWNPGADSGPEWLPGYPEFVVTACVAKMNDIDVEKSCRGLYEQRLKNPRAFSPPTTESHARHA